MPDPLAAASVSPLVSLLIGAVIFVVVIVVIVVVMAILQAILPRTDTGAEEVHAQETEERTEEQEIAPGR